MYKNRTECKNNSLLFFGTWEYLNNENFNSIEFDGVISESGINVFEKSGLKQQNAELIENNIPQSIRLIRLNNSARRQMKSLQNNENLRELEKVQEQINNEKCLLQWF